VVDVKPDPIAGAMGMSAVASPSYMATQTEIIQSDRVSTRVVKLLHLDQSPVAQENWKQSTGGKVPFEYYYGGLMGKGLVVVPSKGANIIVLNFTGQDPGFAAAAANAFAQAYIDTTIDLKVDPARQYAAWFDERLKSLKETLEKAQSKLSAFQREKGIVASDERVDQETARLNAMNIQLSQIQGQKVEISSLLKNSGTESSPDVLQSALIQNLKAEISKAETQLGAISGSMGENHPQRQQLIAQLIGLKQQLNTEIQRISGGTATASRATSQKEEELKALIAAQKQRVLDLRTDHDQIAVLMRDVESAQRAYDMVAQRMSQASLESKSEQTNLSILSPAVPPREPSKPKIFASILGSLAGGLALGFGLALGIEFLDRRVRNAEDLTAIEGVPMLGALTPEASQYTIAERIEIALGLLRTWRGRRRQKPVATSI
jgi:chain length determinant protein EpsF